MDFALTSVSHVTSSFLMVLRRSSDLVTNMVFVQVSHYGYYTVAKERFTMSDDSIAFEGNFWMKMG